MKYKEHRGNLQKRIASIFFISRRMELMARSSLYKEGMDSKELDEKWIEVYENDMSNAESFDSVQKIKYILVGIVIGLSINAMETITKGRRRSELNVGNLEKT